ncbi:polysaccharide deacetylase family protein [Paenisporosarcina cavernae]|uniref:Polysaccharide deacetylase family protein n=1 Tax=Paenisporosarcina cavernae TaxID=2320858 RepID=A0A385YTV6_9BACL|nr:polysaccharide deacetylase family protein [Paenisporosarcina cavernae]AYC29108.1 polysaccharide deacetylase family protein [Paenisporosarcina cavernae]
MTYIRNTAILGALLLALSGCGEDNASTGATKDKETVEPPVSEETPSSEVKEDTVEVPEEDVEETPEEITSQYELSEANWTLKPIADAPEKAVLVTIDDAPDKHALEMATKLKELEVPAIFFVNGHFLDSDEEKEVVKAIHEMGFPIGNHTQTHANLKQLSEEEQKQEILAVSDAVEAIIGERPIFFRAPFGSNTDYSKQLVKEEGMLAMNWTYGYDWEKAYMDAAALSDIMINTPYLVNGANLLMHDRDWTNEALPTIIQGFRDKGYGFVDPATIQGVQ